MSTLYLIIGIVLGVAGFGMLLFAMTSSPLVKQRKLERQRKAAENHRPEEGGF
ncbi:hypothetical protein J31TS6_51440 [Brevibacillus reuszeri]|uniref:hypothetical protein n=1 Tax=Brevibacillus reuszeri TaxID=54915 RepID=UPI0013E02A76|nr:hypothetical protein [Brevibacillus reuszeri]GIO09116.1 hypothetical protein J31TS6_51440 [Brevibacillus reuszeri]